MPNVWFRFASDSSSDNIVACTGQRNNHIFRGFARNQKYFVDVFGVHSKIPGLTIKLGATKVVFDRSSPFKLIDGAMETGKLTKFNRKSVFTFKGVRSLYPPHYEPDYTHF